jgi:hypothetical protein
VQADRHIAEAEVWIVKQPDLIARLRAARGNVTRAEELLGTLEQALVTMCEHRQSVIGRCAKQPESVWTGPQSRKWAGDCGDL